MTKFKEEDIKEILLKNGFKLLDCYNENETIGSSKKRVECLFCGHVNTSTLGNLLYRNFKCKECKNNTSLHESKSNCCKISSKVECIYNGIDRLDSNIGYIRGNCVSCCWECNKKKHTSHEKDFIKWINRVYFYYNSNHCIMDYQI